MRALTATLAILLLLIGCRRDQDPTRATPARGDAATATPGDGAQPQATDPKLLAIAARLPADWAGVGVLEQVHDAPHSAPAWAGIGCEVVDEGGKRYVRATGKAARIKNQALARSAAAARARARLAEWLGTERLVGSEITDYWMDAPGGTTLARARVQVTPDWQPGWPVPGMTPEPSPVPIAPAPKP